MATVLGGIRIFSLNLYKINTSVPLNTPNTYNSLIQLRNYAARKGTREKARKKKVKVEVKKVGFIPHNQRNKHLMDLTRKVKRIDDMWKQDPVDNVWAVKYNKLKVYSFSEAVQSHRETHHPTMYNRPNENLIAFIELDMRAEKANRYIDNINRITAIPFPFDHGEERSIIAFAKEKEIQTKALETGATLAGGSEIIKDIQNGNLTMHDFQYVVAHTNILPELVSLRGVMKKKFPNTKMGNLGNNIVEMINKFRTGIKYYADKDDHEQDYAAVETPIGTLNMNDQHLEENLIALLNDVNSIRPRRDEPFITRCFLICEPSKERFKINLEPYKLEKGKTKEVKSDEDEANVEKLDEERVAATN